MNPLLPVFLKALHTYGRVTFVLADDLGVACGFANLDDGTIVLDRRNSYGEMSATIGHELYHLADPDCPEDQVELLAAAMLVPLDGALTGAADGDLRSVAEQYQVDVQMVRARLRGASSLEG